MDAPNMPPPSMVDDAGHGHGNRQPDPEPELVTVNPKSGVPRKRKAREDGQPAQPRRLTRSHEACARCRRKKSKCDSKHPSCSACLAAGVECVQEDRYRQTLKPRGYTDLLEAQIDKCAALLNKFIPGFKLEYLDYHLSNYGVVLQQPEAQAASFMPSPYLGAGVAGVDHLVPEYDPTTGAYPAGPSYPQRTDAFTVDSHGNLEADPAVMLSPVPGASSSSFMPRGIYDPSQPAASGSRLPAKPSTKGSDPMANDVSSTTGLVKAFGVSQKIAKDLKQDHPLAEDVMGGIPNRDTAFLKPHDPTSWHETPIPRTSPRQEQSYILPRDREIANQVLTVYFTELNPHRPIFDEAEVREKVDILYASISSVAEEREAIAASRYHDVMEDSGFLCCVYLIFALGSLCIQNRRMHNSEHVEENWPSPEEFYDYALALKPELQNTISTLQALLILHWYLYTERHGKALWRLVGNMVRLGVELGLHHDPREQGDIFTAEEAQLRMRLWLIALTHDRDTSIIFGRPLAIQRADFNTPPPSRYLPNLEGGEHAVTVFSETFELTSELLHIQGDIVNSLYRPGKLTGEQVVLRAIEIERSLEQWRKKLPAQYQKLLGGSMKLDRQQKVELVLNHVTPERGITMLKYGILRMFLLRSVFNNKLVSAHVRHKALHDAVITAHNVLVVHAQLTAYPEVAFFVSPTPIHVAAMIILFASISKVETLAWGLAKEDVSLSLKLLPLFRWRWNREDQQGSHHLISRLAIKVYGSVGGEQGPVSPPMLIDEMYWLSDTILRSDRPPRIEEVWNQPQPGAPDSQPLPVGLGGDHHEQKLTQSASATLHDQQAQFVAATEQNYAPGTGPADAGTGAGAGAGSAGTVGSSMDIDRVGAATVEGSPVEFDAHGVQALLNSVGDEQSSSTTTTRTDAEGNTIGGTDADEYFDVWSKRDGA